MVENILKLENVGKTFGNFHALKGVDLNLNNGEIMGFIGPNGAGKTTTIRVILGMLNYTGSSKVFGLDSWKDSVEIHKNLSYVPGDVNLWPNLTGGEVIDFFLRLKKQKDKKYKEELIDKFDLDPSKKCRAYSKGNRQKVALIAALSSDVDLYIFDEPTSGLDPLMESIFQEEIRKFKNSGKSVLLSSHILSEVEKLCDQISIIKDGKIIESGKLEDLRHLTMSKIKTTTKSPIIGLGKDERVFDYIVKDDIASFSVDGANLGDVIKDLSKFEIITLESQPPTLEELFMSHYEKEE